ncbi:MAG: HD domain-containing protein [Candidatus Bipolaricaulaceae bacterium]
MLILLPTDSPAWVFSSCAEIPGPVALLRTAGKPPPSVLLRFPLILAPEEVPPPERKDELVLVSPDYTWIIFAKGKGLRAVWLNPQGLLCPSSHPLHDLEICDLGELRKPLEFKLPDLAEAWQILKEQGVPENVIRHSAAVAGVAFFLAEKLRERGIEVDPLLVHRGGLLHDLDKIESLKEGGEHGERAAEILADLGYPELGEIARKHVLRPGKSPQTWPEKIVFYADKLVEGAEVVGLRARLSALWERYPEFRAEISAGEVFVQTLQNQILTILGLSEAELLSLLRGLDFSLPELAPGPSPA